MLLIQKTLLLSVFLFVFSAFSAPVALKAESLRSPAILAETAVQQQLDQILQKDPSNAKEVHKAIEGLSDEIKRGRRSRSSRRIVNGTMTLDYPASGAVLRGADPRSAAAHCSGTLVACDLFLTAAHCIAEDPRPRSYLVFFQNAGFFKLKEIRWPRQQYSFPHWDIAVLVLDRPVHGVTPVPINRSAKPIAGMTGTIVGFGRTGGQNEDYGIKRQGSVTTALCSNTFAGEQLLCWNFDAKLSVATAASNTCNADSGGGLFMDGLERGLPVMKLVGATSGGLKDDCLAGDHSYDSSLEHYKAWIVGAGVREGAPSQCGSLPSIDVDRHVLGDALHLSKDKREVRYTIEVPEATATMRVAMNGEDNGRGQNNFDLFVAQGTEVDPNKAVCKQNGQGQFAFCEFARPKPGPWSILLQRKAGEGLVQVTVTTIPVDQRQ